MQCLKDALFKLFLATAVGIVITLVFLYERFVETDRDGSPDPGDDSPDARD